MPSSTNKSGEIRRTVEKFPVTVQEGEGNLLPIVASLPHSGLALPVSVAKELQPPYQIFLPHQDWHLGALYDFLPQLGIATVAARFSRYVVDPNRALREPYLGGFWRSPITQSTPNREFLYKNDPIQAEVNRRIQHFYHPYHEILRQLIDRHHQDNDTVYVFDLHSFGLSGHNKVCLGDANGRSCEESFIAIVEQAFAKAGCPVSRNNPFNGGHITRSYGEGEGVQALQIELPYSFYLNADDLSVPVVPRLGVEEFRRAKKQIMQVFTTITETFNSMNST